MKRTLTFLLLASLFTAATGALAQGITDPIGDLLPTYIGPQNGDVDVASAFAGYDPATAPRFRWPERLEAAKQEIRRQAEARSAAAESSTAPPAPAPEDQR